MPASMSQPSGNPEIAHSIRAAGLHTNYHDSGGSVAWTWPSTTSAAPSGTMCTASGVVSRFEVCRSPPSGIVRVSAFTTRSLEPVR